MVSQEDQEYPGEGGPEQESVDSQTPVPAAGGSCPLLCALKTAPGRMIAAVLIFI